MRKKDNVPTVVEASVEKDGSLVKIQTILAMLAVVLGLMLAFSIGFNTGVKVGYNKNSHMYDYPYYYDYPPMTPPYALPGDAPVVGGEAGEIRLPYAPGEEEVITGDEAVE